MRIFLVVICLFHRIHSYNLCDIQENLFCNKTQLNAQNHCNIKTSTTVRSRDCSQVGFISTENLRYNFGEIVLELQVKNVTAKLSVDISLLNVKWKKAYIRLSEYVEHNICKLFTIAKNEKLSIHELYYICEWHKAQYRQAKSYVLELKAESDGYFAHRKILYDIPDLVYYGDTVPLYKRLIFTYIDFSNVYEILLKIQPLPEIFNITHYKVEVYKERNGKSNLLDIRLVQAKNEPVLDFEYLTYSEEGYYYFAVSVISSQCPEDACKKTLTPKLYISRRGTPLVIGIVGASFLIPFVLFSFYMWNCRYKYQAALPETVDKILILFKPCFEKHNDVVAALAKAIKYITGIEVMLDPINSAKSKENDAEKWCSDNLILATNIIYINPPLNDDSACELDYMTYSFLKEETKKSNSDKKIIVLNFPYSNRNTPSILTNCAKFELMDEFSIFINVFEQALINSNYQNNINCIELLDKIKLAQAETENFTVMPKIMITEETEPKDEPGEIDVLL